MAEPTLEREWVAPFLVDVRLTLAVQGRGRGDPTFQADEAGAIWRTSLTPEGPATIRVLPGQGSAQPSHSGQPGQPGQPSQEEAPGTTTRVLARAWGPGAEWLLGSLPGLLGLYDDIS